MGKGILKVDTFINHTIDTCLMVECGQAFYCLFKDTMPTKIVTAETSGIAPALIAATFFDIPVIVVRKHRPVTMNGPVYSMAVQSHTHGNQVELFLDQLAIGPRDRVLIIDDFLASGLTIHALAQLVHMTEASLVGIGILIEKDFEHGRDLLEHLGVPIHSLATIIKLGDDDKSVFVLERMDKE